MQADDHGADDSAAHPLRCEGFDKNADKRRRYLFDVQAEDDDPGRQIDEGHQGNERLGDQSDHADSGDDHEPDRERDADPERKAVLETRRFGKLGEGLVDLEERDTRPDAENRKEGGKDRPESCITALCEPLLNVMHRASRYGAVRIDPAVGDAERAFHHLGRHSQDARQDHPEHGSGTADRNGHGDSRDVADADRSGERGAQRLEMGQVARLVRTRVLPAHDLQRQTEIADTRKAEIQRENQSRRDQPKGDHRNVQTGDVDRKKDDLGDHARNR